MDRLITHLRHVDLAVPDFDTQLAFYRDLWKLSLETTDTGIAFLAAAGSPEQYQVRLRADADALAEKLGREGVTLVSTPDKMQTPGGGYGFRFFDLEGRTIEVSSDVALRAHRRVEEGESVPVKLSHVVINSPQPEALVAWY